MNHISGLLNTYTGHHYEEKPEWHFHEVNHFKMDESIEHFNFAKVNEGKEGKYSESVYWRTG